MEEELRHISIENLSINPSQPRRIFNEEELQELSSSIKSIGLLQPPIVRLLDTNNNYFEIIAGERRFRAAKMAGLKTIPVIIRKYSSLESARAALIENLQRVDLNPIETAAAIRSLMVQFELKQEDVALKLGKKRSTIANYLRLLSLPQVIQESVSSGSITTGHAKVLLSLQETHFQLLLHEKIIHDALTVRETEKWVDKWNTKCNSKEQNEAAPNPPPLCTRNFYLEDLARKLQEALGSKVDLIEKGKQGGRIMIDYHNYDDLDRLLEIFLREKE